MVSALLVKEEEKEESRKQQKEKKRCSVDSAFLRRVYTHLGPETRKTLLMEEVRSRQCCQMAV